MEIRPTFKSEYKYAVFKMLEKYNLLKKVATINRMDL